MRTLIIALLLCIALANVAQGARLKHSQPYPPAGWRDAGVADARAEVKLTFALRHRNQAEAMQLVDEISMRSLGSENFRKYLSVEQIRDRFGPSDATVAAVRQFLEDEVNARDISVTMGHESISFVASVGDIERAMGVRMRRFRHFRSDRIVTRASAAASLSQMLPKLLAKEVDLILGLHDFFDTRFERSGKVVGKPLQPLLPKDVADSSDSANTTAPWIMMVMGGAQDVVVYFYANCQNGQISSNVTAPCADHGSPITNFQINVKPMDFPPMEVSLPTEAANCVLVDGQVICHVTVQLTKPYVRCDIETVSRFADDTTSDIYHYPTAYAPTEYIRPDTIYELYNIPKGTRGLNAKSSQAIVSFEEQYISFTDLQSFFTLMGQRQATPVVVGPNDPSMPGGESTLDVQWVMGIGQGINTTVWSFPEGDYILNWALAVADTPDAPLVTSISYGDTEIGYIQKSGYGLEYMHRMNFELAKMAMRGLTVIGGSGDAGWTNVGEMGNDLSDPDQTCTPQRAFYPSCSPYVMSLSSTFVGLEALGVCGQPITPYPGAGQLAVPVTCDILGEIAVGVSQGMSWTTGGGFSNVTTRHDYQDAAVSEFIATSPNLPPSEYWDYSGQGYPDISTIGWNQLVVWDGVLFPIGGTSASGPVAAGIFALINDVLLNAGKAPLGFVNPMLYEWAASDPSAFQDVTVGNNNDGDIQPPGSPYPTYCQYGYTSQAGWDAVTGLGTPNYEKLVQLALQLP